MIPQKTIEELIAKHTMLEKDLSSVDIDKKLFAEKSKEYADINEIIGDARKYIAFENNKKELEKILNDSSGDEELKDMAELELSELNIEHEKYEKKLKLFYFYAQSFSILFPFPSYGVFLTRAAAVLCRSFRFSSPASRWFYQLNLN